MGEGTHGEGVGVGELEEGNGVGVIGFHHVILRKAQGFKN